MFDFNAIADRYLGGQSVERFLAEGGDAREYARLVFAGEVFPHEDPAAPELGVETEADLVEALETLARGVTLQVATLDPHTKGIVYEDGEGVEIIRFDFYSEDRQEWERLADEALERNGFRRVSEWRDTDLGNTADVVRA